MPQQAQPYRVVNLLRNRIYPTYQFFGKMASSKTSPQDGLRLGALITMHWLACRLGEHAPASLRKLPSPDRYRSCGDKVLTSLHINQGYRVDIVSLPEQGVWTLQISEPDLGSDPGNPEQRRAAEPGRVIETAVAFRIVGRELECGFRTVISDPEGVSAPAEVYRLAIIRLLVENPDFGLRQITVMKQTAETVSSAAQLRELLAVRSSSENALPIVIFTEPEEAPDVPDLKIGMRLDLFSAATPIFKIPPVQAPPVSRSAYDADRFARSTVTFCRVCVLESSLLNKFCELTDVRATAGDIVVLEPAIFGGASRKLPYQPSDQHRAQTVDALKQEMISYPRGKELPFGQVAFLAEARELLLRSAINFRQRSELLDSEREERLRQLTQAYKDHLSEKEQEIDALVQKLEKQKSCCGALEKTVRELRAELGKKQALVESAASARDEEIAYLRRRIDRPNEHRDIPAWVQKYFGERLILHENAVRLLSGQEAKIASLDLICDALDHLATDYWAGRWLRISKAELLSRCSQKYGRPFEIKPVGDVTITYAPNQYRVPYGRKGALRDLDTHLCVGIDAEKLLRIYFFHDDDLQKIVIGSLPRHLDTFSRL
ncbi:MAG: hypothetical protein IJD20_03600 [Oscillospiraceae bacterium]|nr:hypothetical protein [Oscillospiraceae bacterium]